MSHYSNDPRSVRVDFWKGRQDGFKWYTTEAVIWTGKYEDGLIHCEFAKSLHDHLLLPEVSDHVQGRYYRLDEMLAICLEPYHKNEHPIALYVSNIRANLRDRDKYLDKLT